MFVRSSAAFLVLDDWWLYLSMLEVVEGASGLLRGGRLLGCHLISHFALNLLLALLARLNAMEPAWVPQILQLKLCFQETLNID